MITVRLIGGLGNQMFQYAAGLALAERLGSELVMDVRGFETYKLRQLGIESFHISARRATEAELARYPEGPRTFFRLLNKLIRVRTRYYFEPAFGHNPDWDSLSGHVQLNGYFQEMDTRFQAIRPRLQAEFALKETLNERNRELAEQARGCESVMLHVRRGDYLSVSQNVAIFGVCSLDYYRKAIATMRERTTNPRFFVFSDDMAWARANLPLDDSAVFVEGNGSAQVMDMYLMSQCRHHIIANSSFSWWGAWLADVATPSVIAPSPWFDDLSFSDAKLIPARWQRLLK